jgi:DNA gyrase inhibitor GyrI
MKRSKVVIILAVALPLALIAAWLVRNSRMATETPDYKVVRVAGEFEIRDYPALSVASAPLNSGEMDGSFRRLFRYISGDNAQSEKIAMTTPVLIETAKDEPAMNFIMPRKVVVAGVPEPSGSGMSIGQLPASRFAVLRFSGGHGGSMKSSAIEKVRSWLETEKLAAKGDPIVAYYDPPWTPNFIRRNEVMIPIETLHE